MADGRLTGEEAEDVRAWIARIVGDGYSETGLSSIGVSAQVPDMLLDHSQVEFRQRTFVMTGALRIGPRREIAQMIERHGGMFCERITLQTDYVVVALAASRDWRATHFGTKLERARELIDRGASLRLLAEHAFEAALTSR